jgi:hypothetical protein
MPCDVLFDEIDELDLLVPVLLDEFPDEPLDTRPFAEKLPFEPLLIVGCVDLNVERLLEPSELLFEPSELFLVPNELLLREDDELLFDPNDLLELLRAD